MPRGWKEVEMCLQGRTWLIPVVVLDATSLAFSALLGLYFTYFTGMVWDVASRVYWFRDDETGKYPFSEESSPRADGEASNCIIFSSVEAPPATTLLPSLDSLENTNLALKAIQDSHLEEHLKPSLRSLLFNNLNVCTTKVGRTRDLPHQFTSYLSEILSSLTYETSNNERAHHVEGWHH